MCALADSTQHGLCNKFKQAMPILYNLDSLHQQQQLVKYKKSMAVQHSIFMLYRTEKKEEIPRLAVRQCGDLA